MSPSVTSAHIREQGLLGDETGWELGPLAPLLQILPRDTPLLYLQNTNKLYGTKNNRVHEQLEQILDQKIQKSKNTTKPPTAPSEEPGAKTGCQEQSRVLYMPLALYATKGWTDHLSNPFSLIPGHTPTQTPHNEPT